MRKLLGFAVFMVLGCASAPPLPFVEHGACTPDIMGSGKVSKLPTVLWNKNIHSTSFVSRGLNQTGKDIVVIFGKYENMNIVNISIQIDEKSKINPQFVSGYRAQKGDTFSFGFTNGTPLKFVAGDVSNVTQPNYMKDMPSTTVVLSATVDNRDLATISDLAKKQIDSVRIELSGAVRLIEESVDSSDSKKLMEKFICFQQYLDRSLSSTPIDNSPASINETREQVKGKWKLVEIAIGDKGTMVSLVKMIELSEQEKGKTPRNTDNYDKLVESISSLKKASVTITELAEDNTVFDIVNGVRDPANNGTWKVLGLNTIESTIETKGKEGTPSSVKVMEGKIQNGKLIVSVRGKPESSFVFEKVSK